MGPRRIGIIHSAGDVSEYKSPAKTPVTSDSDQSYANQNSVTGPKHQATARMK